MAFSLPNFNIPGDVYINPNLPSSGTPDLTGVLAQVYLHSRGDWDMTPANNDEWNPTIHLRFDFSTLAVFGYLQVKNIWTYTDVNGFVYNYRCRWWDVVHPGFSNQYLLWLCEQVDKNGNSPDPFR